MSSKVEVSIICDTFNHEKYIENALKSFVCQKTKFKFEIIIHDDASSDGTQGIVLKYKKIYPQLIKCVFEKENLYSKGISHFWESTFKEIKGKYVAICEGDDFWVDENKLQLQHDYMEKNDSCSLCAHKAIRVSEDGSFLSIYSKRTLSDPTFEESVLDLSLFPTSSMFFKKSFYTNNEHFLRSVPMFDYVLKILLANEGSVHILEETMSAYRTSSQGSWTQRITKDRVKHRNHYLESISIIAKIDHYTNHNRSAVLKKIIKQREFTAALIINDYKTVFSPAYRECYKKLRLISRIKLRIKYMFGI